MSVVAHTMVNVEIDLARSTLEDYEPGDSLDTFIVSAGGKSDDVDVPDQSPEDIASVALAFPHSGDEAIITIAGVGLEEGDSWRPQNVAVEAHNPELNVPLNVLWWFGGESVNGYHTSETITIDDAPKALKKVEWEITGETAAAEMHNVINGQPQTGDELDTGTDKSVLLRTTGGSTELGDVTVKAKVDGVEAGSVDFTVKQPKDVVLVEEEGVENPKTVAWGDGFKTTYTFQIRDQFEQPLPSSVPIHEEFGERIPDDDTNGTWGDIAADGITTGQDARFTDTYGTKPGTFNFTAATPSAVNPDDEGDDDPVFHIHQEYWVGSLVQGHGIKVKEHTLQVRRGRAEQI